MSWTHLSDREPMARMPHKCYLCGRTIPAGERHVLRVGSDDGRLVSGRMHSACEKLTHSWDEYDWYTHDRGEFLDMLDKLAQAAPAEGGAS